MQSHYSTGYGVSAFLVELGIFSHNRISCYIPSTTVHDKSYSKNPWSSWQLTIKWPWGLRWLFHVTWHNSRDFLLFSQPPAQGQAPPEELLEKKTVYAHFIVFPHSSILSNWSIFQGCTMYLIIVIRDLSYRMSDRKTATVRTVHFISVSSWTPDNSESAHYCEGNQ